MPLRLTRRPDSPVWHLTGTVAGQRIRETTGTADRRLADEYRATREAQLYRGAVHGAEAVVTWEDACLSYIEVVLPSVGSRRLLLRLTEHLGRMRLADINQPSVDRAVATLCRPGAAPSTKLRNVIVPIQAVLNHAARRGWCSPPLVEKPRGATGIKRTRWLTPAEYERLVAAAAPHLKPLLAFLCGTGARLGEALALDWRDVELRHQRALLRDTKNGRDHLAELPPATVAALAAIEHRTGPVFRTDDGAPYRPRLDAGGHIKTAWGGACRRAGIRDASPHTLRHTFASWHYALHRDLLRLRRDGGWQTVSQVERYAKLAPDALVPEIRAAWGLPKVGTGLAQSQKRNRKRAAYQSLTRLASPLVRERSRVQSSPTAPVFPGLSAASRGARPGTERHRCEPRRTWIGTGLAHCVTTTPPRRRARTRRCLRPRRPSGRGTPSRGRGRGSLFAQARSCLAPSEDEGRDVPPGARPRGSVLDRAPLHVA